MASFLRWIAGRALTFELNTALRRAGFDRVFDTNFTADLTILEEGTELLLRLQKVPKSDFDSPFGSATGSGVIFGATGGVMEAALRTVIEVVTGTTVEELFSHADIQAVPGVTICSTPTTPNGGITSNSHARAGDSPLWMRKGPACTGPFILRPNPSRRRTRPC